MPVSEGAEHPAGDPDRGAMAEIERALTKRIDELRRNEHRNGGDDSG